MSIYINSDTACFSITNKKKYIYRTQPFPNKEREKTGCFLCFFINKVMYKQNKSNNIYKNKSNNIYKNKVQIVYGDSCLGNLDGIKAFRKNIQIFPACIATTSHLIG